MKKSLIIVFFSFFICAVFGCITKSSYTNNIPTDTETGDCVVEYIGADFVLEMYQDTSELLQILSESDLIAKVKFTGNRKQMYESTLSSVIVLDVYKGDSNLVGNQIDVFEINFFGTKGFYRNISLFNLIQKDKEYYVFLREKKYMNDYQNQLELPRYMCTNVDFSVISTEAEKNAIYNLNEKLFFSDVKESEYICFSKAEQEKIESIKSEIIQYFIINNSTSNVQ